MNILIKPIITEKATHLSENKNQYTFLVNGEANKIQIKSAVEVNYGVKVKKVSTIICGSERKKDIQKMVFKMVRRIPQKKLSLV